MISTKIQAKNLAYVELHVAVVLFGITAVLGELISLSAVTLVWWRVLIAGISYFIFLRVTKRHVPNLGKHEIKYIWIGFLIAVHWITFYAAIKLSNASIGVISMATTSIFAAILEPFIVGKRFRKREVLVGFLMIPGMYLVVDDLDTSQVLGFSVGLLSAFLSSLFACYNKKHLVSGQEARISMIEMFAACLFCSPFVFYMSVVGDQNFLPVGMDYIYLIILAIACTTVAFLLALRAMNYVSAFVSNLAINLEPVYGIVLAILLLNQHKELNTQFYIGVVIIMVIVFSFPFLPKPKDS
jgi:drug/metabolite transporter (DMT)-like permease